MVQHKFNFSRDLLDGLYFFSAMDTQNQQYSWFMNAREGLVFATVDVAANTYTVSPPNILWSEQHQPLSISWDPSRNVIYSVLYYETQQPAPRRLYSVDPTTWTYTILYEWPIGDGSDFRTSVYDHTNDVVHMLLTKPDGNGDTYLYLHSVYLSTKQMNFMNITNTPNILGDPSHYVYNTREGNIWAIAIFQNNYTTGLVKIDPKSGKVSESTHQTFTSTGWGYGSTSGTLDPTTGYYIKTFTEDDQQFLVSVDGTGAIVSKAPVTVGFGSLGAL